jgi:hypothetical protein
MPHVGRIDHSRHSCKLEHFRAKWMPVRVKKMRQNKDLELLSDSAETESALELKRACKMVSHIAFQLQTPQYI